MTVFETTLSDKATSRAAMVDLDATTKLLVYDGSILRVLPRKKKPIPEQYQWPIVTALTQTRLKPLTRLWVGLKPGALPEPIIRAFLRDGAAYVVERAFNTSDRAWRVVSILEQRARVNQLSTISKLQDAWELCDALKASCHSVSDQHAVAALRSASSEDLVVGARLLCAKALDAKASLRAPSEGDVLSALAKKLSRLCDKALRKHPMREVLIKKI